jgi:L-fuculose-phosphate aldolase
MKIESLTYHYRSVLSEYSIRAFQRGLVGGTGGNLSLKIPGTDTVLITPSGVALEETTPENCVLVDLEGNILESPLGFKGSKETTFHCSAYKLRPDVQSVVHVHPYYATAFACTKKPLPLATVPSRLIFKEIPCIPCFNPGSRELAESVKSAIENNLTLKAFLMQDHGILVLGPDIDTAYYWADLVEHTAKVAYLHKQIAR